MKIEQLNYDYCQNPFIEGPDGFKALVRDPNKSPRHPWLHKREVEASRILSELPKLPIPQYADPRLRIYPEDQGLVLTPFDDFEGMRVETPPREHVEGWKVLWEYNLRLANHPSRIFAMRELEQAGFKPPNKSTNVVGEALKEKTILQLADISHALDIALYVAFSTYYESVGEAMVELLTNKNLSPEDTERLSLLVEEFVGHIEQTDQAHRTELLATGPFTLIGGHGTRETLAISFVGVGAMPDIAGSVLMGETASKMMVPIGIPEIAKYSDINQQAALAKGIMGRLRADDPLLEGRSDEEKEYILKHWRACPTGVLEVDPNKALKRAEKLAEAGVTTFRLYGHTRGGTLVKTVRALRNEYPDARIIAGQVNLDTALACQWEGADAVIGGVGAGGRCTTARLAEFNPTNAILPALLRGKLVIPYWGEGGYVDYPISSMLAGVSLVNGSGSIGGGTFEAPGGMYFLTKDGRVYKKPYRGEASRGNKHLSSRIFATGVPYVPEGEETFKSLVPLEESATQNIVNQWTRINLGAVVLNIDAGPFVVPAIQNFDPSPLFKNSRTTAYIQNTH